MSILLSWVFITSVTWLFMCIGDAANQLRDRQRENWIQEMEAVERSMNLLNRRAINSYVPSEEDRRAFERLSERLREINNDLKNLT
jgi:hypothetical protein